MSISINDTANAAAGAAVVPDQVAEFVAGKVPAGWEQVAGPTASIADELFVAVDYRTLVNAPKDTTNSRRAALIEANGRLFSMTPESSGHSIVEVGPDLRPTQQKLSTGSSEHASYRRFGIALSDGDVLIFRAGQSAPSSTSILRFNVDTRTTTALQSKPTNFASSHVQAAQAGDDVVYCMGIQATGQVDAYDVAQNEWHENVATAPFTALQAVSIRRLPSGKLLFTNRNMQLVFNPITREFEQNLEQRGVWAAAETPHGVRLYVINSDDTLSYVDYTEATDSLSIVNTTTMRPTSPGSAALPTTTDGYLAESTPFGYTVFKSCGNGGEVAYLHYLSYAPRGVVKAAKQ